MEPKRLRRFDDSNKSHRRLVVIRVKQPIGLMLIVDHDFGIGRSTYASELGFADISNQVTVVADLYNFAMYFRYHRYPQSCLASNSPLKPL